ALSGQRLIDEVLRENASSRLDRVDIAQPALFLVQVALSALWKSWGVEPGLVIGHSLGEIAAAHVAGAISLTDAARIVLARSALLAGMNHGGMLACGVSPDEGERLIRGFEDRVAVGVVNGSRSVVLSGDAGALEEIARRLEGSDVFVRRVNTRAASHSPLVDPILDQFRGTIARIVPRELHTPLYSTVTAQPIMGAELTPDYWARNLRGQVLLGPAVQRILESGERLFLEISAHPLLLA